MIDLDLVFVTPDNTKRGLTTVSEIALRAYSIVALFSGIALKKVVRKSHSDKSKARPTELGEKGRSTNCLTCIGSSRNYRSTEMMLCDMGSLPEAETRLESKAGLLIDAT
jgi:hypothetical protein